MTEKLPLLSGRRVAQAFVRLGWLVARQKGSHIVLVKPGHIAHAPRDEVTGVNSMSVEEDLNELGIAGVDGGFHPVTDDEIRSAEEQLKLQFPPDYREFIKYFGFTSFDKEVSFQPKNPSPCAREDGSQDIDVFYGVGPGEFGLIRMTELYSGRLPNGLIPVAEAPGGNQILLGVDGPARGRVYFWDHEDEPSTVGDLVLVADSFRDLLARLRLDEGRPKSKRPRLIDYKVSDDF